MSALDREILAEKTSAVQRHLARVADLAMSACLHLRLGAPGTYADAFRRLADAGHLEPELATRLERAAGFRNVVAHAYERLDMARIHRAARHGPDDLRAFLATLNRLVTD